MRIRGSYTKILFTNKCRTALEGGWCPFQNGHQPPIINVGRQEHSPIRVRAQRGFSVLRDQVLVLFFGQELGPFADNGQELDTIADLIIIKSYM